MIELDEAGIPMLAQASASAKQVEQLPVELRAVAETVAEGGGFWTSCTGCYDTEDGRPTRNYAHSDVFGCALGDGCSECGGLGAVWDDTDYADMAEFIEEQDATPAPGATPDFEAFARRHGMPLMRASVASFGATRSGIPIATYYEDFTEGAWRAWANKPSTSPAELTLADAVAHIERKAEEYANQFGYGVAGTLCFDSQVKMDHYTSLTELADELRELAAPASSESPAAPTGATLTLPEAVNQEVQLILTDPDSTLSNGAQRALRYIARVVAAQQVSPAAPQPSAKALTDYSYQQLFDAIAAATHVSAGNVAVSVKDFRAALLASEQPSEPGSSCDPADVCAGCRCKYGACYRAPDQEEQPSEDERDAANARPITASPAEIVSTTAAARDVLAERRRQVTAEGRTPEHDDQHDDSEMALAASWYAASPFIRYELDEKGLGFWPWAQEWWKPGDRRRELVKAGALILAEIERLDRAAIAKGEA